MSRHVLITRHASDCAELERLVGAHGVAVTPYPVLRLVDAADEDGWSAVLTDVPPARAAGAWLVLASPRAPGRFVEQARARQAAHLTGLPTAAVGEGTAASARAHGLGVELTGPGTGLGLAEELLPRLQPNAAVVFACGRHRRDELPAALAEAGHRVRPVVVYEMLRTPAAELPEVPPAVDTVVLTSPRAARYYLDGVGGSPLHCTHWALGTTTQQAAAAIGIRCRIPARPDIPTLAEELCQS